jgi:WD40 repeat protein
METTGPVSGDQPSGGNSDDSHFRSSQHDNDSDHLRAPIQPNLRVLKPSARYTTIRSMAFSTNGELAASGTSSGQVLVWWIVDKPGKSIGMQERSISHMMDVLSLAFSPDCSRLASGSADNSVKLSFLSTRPFPDPQLESHKAGVSAVAFSSDNEYFASGSTDGEVRIWKGETGEYTSIMCQAGVHSAAFLQGDQLLAVGLEDRTVRVWDRSTTEQVQQLSGHQGVPTTLAFSPQGLLASGSGNSIALSDFEARVNTIPVHQRDVVISPNRRFSVRWQIDPPYRSHIAYIKDGTTMVEQNLRRTRTPFYGFSPDSRIFALGEGSMIERWDTARNVWLAKLSVSGKIAAFSFSLTGPPLFAATKNELYIWRDVTLDQPQSRRIATPDAILASALSPNDQTVATVTTSSVQLWDWEFGVRTMRLGNYRNRGGRSWVAFASDGRRLVASLGFRTHVWDTATGHLLQVFPVDGLQNAVSSNCHVIATVRTDGSSYYTNRPIVSLWDATTGALLRERHFTDLPPGTYFSTIAFSPENDLVMMTSDKEIKWRECLPALTMPSAVFHAVGFSPDGLRLASGAGHEGHGDVLLWEISTGRREPGFYNLESVPIAVQFSADKLIIGLQDGTVRIKDSI